MLTPLALAKCRVTAEGLHRDAALKNKKQFASLGEQRFVILYNLEESKSWCCRLLPLEKTASRSIHFHHTPNIFNMGLKKSDYTNLIQNNRTCWLLYIPGFLWFVCVVRKQRILCDNAKRVYTCYTCDNDETLVPWAPGTPNSTVNTEFPLDSSVIKETLTVQMIDLTCFLCF